MIFPSFMQYFRFRIYLGRYMNAKKSPSRVHIIIRGIIIIFIEERKAADRAMMTIYATAMITHIGFRQSGSAL